MAYHKLEIGEIRTDIIYLSVPELARQSGIGSVNTIHRHIKKDLLNAYKFRGKTFILPNEAEQ